MWNIKEQIVTAANSLNISIEEVSASKTEEMVRQITLKYVMGSGSAPIWENLINEIGINNKDAWKWVSEFIGDTETIMFFNPCDERTS
jgi:hypothetical protein